MKRRLLALLFSLFAVFPLLSSATTVSGRINYAGQPLNGYVSIGLVYPGTNGSALDLPGNPGPIPISNGLFPQTVLDGNDTLLPRGTFYQVTYYDAYQSPLARMNYVITGATFDLGAAVPTPVTTSNINYLDLLNLRTISAQTLILSNGLQFGPTMTIGAGGIAGAPSINSIIFAAFQSPTTTTTCGLAESLALLPSTGGTIVLPPGTCTLTSPVTISKPVIIYGLGQGGVVGTSTFSSPTLLINGTPSSDLLTIAPASSSPLSGITLSNFAIQGNIAVPGVSSGSNIVIAGGTSGVNDVTLSHLLLRSADQSGIAITGDVENVHIEQDVIPRNNGPGISISSVGLVRSIDIDRATVDLSGADGLLVDGAGVQSVSVIDSSFTNSVANGVNITSAATSSTLHLSRITASNNGNAGVLVNGGVGHVVESSFLLLGTHQLYGVYTSQPTLASTINQLTLRDNTFGTNSTADVFQSATVSNMVMYPQATTNYTTSYGALSNVHTIAFVISTTASDQYISFSGPNIVGSGGINNVSSGITTATFSPAQIDTSYTVESCMVTNTTGATDFVTVNGITSSSTFTYNLQQVQNNGGNTFSTTIACHLHHP